MTDLAFLASKAALELDYRQLGTDKGLVSVKQLAKELKELFYGEVFLSARDVHIGLSLFDPASAAQIRTNAELIQAVIRVADKLNLVDEHTDVSLTCELRSACSRLSRAVCRLGEPS